MRAANWVLFIGTIGFINVYQDMTDEDGDKMDPADAKRLQKKFGVKEKRSAVQQTEHELSTHFEEFTERLVEYVKKPLARGLVGCSDANSDNCDCMRIICFGQNTCTKNVTKLQPNPPIKSKRLRHAGGSDLRRKLKGHSRYRGYRLSASKSDVEEHLLRFITCSQTTMNSIILCECKEYTRIER